MDLQQFVSDLVPVDVAPPVTPASDGSEGGAAAAPAAGDSSNWLLNNAPAAPIDDASSPGQTTVADRDNDITIEQLATVPLELSPGGNLVNDLLGAVPNAEGGDVDPFMQKLNDANNGLSVLGAMGDANHFLNDKPEPPGDGSGDVAGDGADGMETPNEKYGTELPDEEPAADGLGLGDFLDAAGDASNVVGAFQGGWQYGQAWDQQQKQDGSAGQDASGQNRSWSDKEGDDGTAVHDWVKDKLGGGLLGSVAGDVLGLNTTVAESVIGTGKAIGDLPKMAESYVENETTDVIKGDEQEEKKMQAEHPLLYKALGYLPGGDAMGAEAMREGDATDARIKNIEDATGMPAVAQADEQNFKDHPILQTIEDMTGVGEIKDEYDAHKDQIAQAESDPNVGDKVMGYLDGSTEYKAAARFMDIDVSKWPI